MEKQEISLHPLLSRSFIIYGLLILTFAGSLLYVNSVSRYATGSAFLLFVFIATTPAMYLMVKNEVKNRYTGYLLAAIYLLTLDTLYYSNVFVMNYLPSIVILMIYILYSGLMIQTNDAYRMVSNLFVVFNTPVRYVKMFLGQISFTMVADTVIIKKIGIATAITVPFVIVFIALLTSADQQYNQFIKQLFDFSIDFSIFNTLKVVAYMILFLMVIITSLSVKKAVDQEKVHSALDTLIVSIFLGSITFLFFSYVAIQFQYLFGGIDHTSLSHSQYARKGFFELAAVMTIASSILLFVYQRLSDQPIVKYLQIVMSAEVMMIGWSSLHKMQMYQLAYGQTHLRYYVEWFIYFLLVLLATFIAYLLLKKRFVQFLNVVTMTSIAALCIVASINVDKMIMQSHLDNKHNRPLDYDYLAKTLSVDILDADGMGKIDFDQMHYRQNGAQFDWLDRQRFMRRCHLLDYHIGYCNAVASDRFDALVQKKFDPR